MNRYYLCFVCLALCLPLTAKPHAPLEVQPVDLFRGPFGLTVFVTVENKTGKPVRNVRVAYTFFNFFGGLVTKQMKGIGRSGITLERRVETIRWDKPLLPGKAWSAKRKMAGWYDAYQVRIRTLRIEYSDGSTWLHPEFSPKQKK